MDGVFDTLEFMTGTVATLIAPSRAGPAGYGIARGRNLGLLTLLLLFLGGCTLVGTVPTALPPPPPLPVVVGGTQDGIASWYGEPFHGRRTSSGEVYDMEATTAAHRTLPFGTVVRVENLTNGRNTTLRINDRGPFIDGRIIDLSR